MTKKELEKQLNTGEGYLSRCTKEGCAQEPSVQVIKNLGDILEVTVDQLMYQNIEEDEDTIESKYLDEKEKLFFKKLIDETRETKISWEEFRLAIGYDESYYDALFEAEYDQDGMTGRFIFNSMFTGFNNEYYAAKAYKSNIGDDTEVILIYFDYDERKDTLISIYEVYIVKKDKVYPSCICDVNDKEKFRNLKLLWEAIEIDVPRYVVLKAYSDFLDNHE